MNRRVGETTIIAIVTTVIVAFVVMFANVTNTHAIPAFSRKYQTSCTTCHSNYPELNDFGEAFKKNGFKFPKDDETFVKEPPVLLGAKAQKEAFPRAVYPGELPGSVPIAFRYEGNFTWNKKQPAGVIESSGFSPRTDLFTPNTFTIIGAGSFGPNFSFWIDDDLSTGGSGADGGLGDGYLKYNDLGHALHLPKNALNVRFGQFELDLPFTQARTIYPSDYDVYDQASVAGSLGTTNNPFVLGAPQRGIEFGGYPNNGNFTWSVALVNGNNDGTAARSTKDVYIRVSQRFNLERDPESRNAIQAAGPTGPRDHTSIRVGAFYYYGKNQLNLDGVLFPGLGVLNQPFYRIGGDLRFKYRHMELYGVGLYGHDQNQILNASETGFERTTPVTYSGGFAGINYWIHPWMIAYMRYDFVNSPTDFLNGVSQYNTRNRYSPGFQILVRANIKVIGEYEYNWGQPFVDPVTGSTHFFKPHTFVTGIDYVF
ncbi:MAG TPA: hypothetical protein VN749_13730 [Candidatus Eisenbacteria bacterium]|jgi:hypothetical protein|nr:hypothetical protein [Candidatus Eisenbacteria bacterium]